MNAVTARLVVERLRECAEFLGNRRGSENGVAMMRILDLAAELEAEHLEDDPKIILRAADRTGQRQAALLISLRRVLTFAGNQPAESES